MQNLSPGRRVMITVGEVLVVWDYLEKCKLLFFSYKSTSTMIY